MCVCRAHPVKLANSAIPAGWAAVGIALFAQQERTSLLPELARAMRARRERGSREWRERQAELPSALIVWRGPFNRWEGARRAASARPESIRTARGQPHAGFVFQASSQ